MENHMSYLFNNEVGFVGNAVDAFNRLKVSQPFTMFDSQNRYQVSDKWDVFAATGGFTGYVLSESVRTLGVTLTAGSKCTAETKRVFPYQPGKSLLIINTFVWPTKITGLRRRVGYFGITGGATAGIPYNGVYLEQNGLTLSINLASGSLNTTITANQSDWNGDKFDGTGASGRTLDTSKGNILKPYATNTIIVVTHHMNTVSNVQKYVSEKYGANVTSLAGFSQGGKEAWRHASDSSYKLVGLIDHLGHNLRNLEVDLLI